MGICHEFGPTIQAGCTHPMQATRPDACTCSACGIVCHGKFAGCSAVWARGPQKVYWRSEDELEAGPHVDSPAAERATPRQTQDLAAAVQVLADEVDRLRQEVNLQHDLLESLPEVIRRELQSLGNRPGGVPSGEPRDAQSSLLRRLVGAAVPPAAGAPASAPPFRAGTAGEPARHRDDPAGLPPVPTSD